MRSPLLITASSTASLRSRTSSACTSSAVRPSPTSAKPMAFQPGPGSSPSISASSPTAPPSPIPSERSPVPSASASASLSPSADGSTHSWHMPCPYGPSRSTVCGIRFQPMASDSSYDATSRCARVPSGKSHSGRSPATGLYTHAALWPSYATVQYSTAFDASRTLPCTVSSPSVSSSGGGVTPRGDIRSGAGIRVPPGRAADCTAGTAGGRR